MAYVDGFILAVKKDRLDEYKDMARLAASVWKEYGAHDYVEALADDAPYGELTSFPRAVMAKDDEIVVFSYATYRDRAHRDEVMKKVMADPRMDPGDMSTWPFDGKRMIFGGFETFISAGSMGGA